MNSDVEKQTSAPEATSVKHTPPLDLNTEAPGSLSKMSSPENNDWQDIVDKVVSFLDVFPDSLNQTFDQYQKPLTTVGLILALMLSVAIADGVLDVLNTIPLLAPILELVGLGYTGWFVWRYLRYAETREEFLQNYRNVKSRITGKND